MGVQNKNSEDHGALFGSAGILYMLLKVPELALGEYKTKLLCSLHFFKERVGEFLTDCSSTVLYTWQSGVPGMISTLIEAYQVFGEDDFLTMARNAADSTWNYGILRNNHYLMSGTFGNIYPLLHLYNVTADTKYLARAYQFCISVEDARIAVIS